MAHELVGKEVRLVYWDHQHELPFHKARVLALEDGLIKLEPTDSTPGFIKIKAVDWANTWISCGAFVFISAV
jgi:hypothetical protein